MFYDSRTPGAKTDAARPVLSFNILLAIQDSPLMPRPARALVLAPAALAVWSSLHAAHAEVKPNFLFTDDAVLQCDAKIPVWGQAHDGEQVTVTFAGQERSTTARDGRWRVELDPVAAGGPHDMTIVGDNSITVKNILVGEVWICSGQSNMQFEVKDAADAAATIAASANPNLRCFTVMRWGASEEERKRQNKWLAASPETTGSFTAVGYHFGRDLQQHLGVPVGLISSNYGGTNAEAWMDRNTLASEPAIAARFEAWMKANNNFGGGAGGLFDGMVKALAPYAFRGVIWYQGESNASRAADYRRLLALLIRDWRAAWNQGDFPFLIVQLAPFANGENKWPEIRAAQMYVARTTPNVATVVTTDVGDAADIHPKNKRPIGERLALAARGVAYREDVEYRGPEPVTVRAEGPSIRLRFRRAGQGLKYQGAAPTGFEVAGADGKFIDAEAKITDPDVVIVSSPAVKAPISVRFAWKDFNAADLWSSTGLPAPPFRIEGLPRSAK